MPLPVLAVDVKFFYVAFLFVACPPDFEPCALAPVLRITFALNRFATTSIYGGMTRQRKQMLD